MRVSMVLLALLAGLFALPATTMAAGSCELTTAVSPGHVITVTGRGFAACFEFAIRDSWSVSNATAGGNTGPQTTTTTVPSDASGGFTFTIDAGPGHGGTYHIEATAGACTATTQVSAVETAGGINHGTTGGTTTGAAATPPATDTAPIAVRGWSVPFAPIVAVLIGSALLAFAFVLRRGREVDPTR